MISLKAGLIIAAVLGLMAIGAKLTAPLWQWRLNAAWSAATKAQGRAATAEGQVIAAEAVAPVLEKARARDVALETRHAENARIIAAAPGADQVVDPDLALSFRRGLCGYASYRSDPSCSELREAGAPVLPDSHPAGAAAPAE